MTLSIPSSSPPQTPPPPSSQPTPKRKRSPPTPPKSSPRRHPTTEHTTSSAQMSSDAGSPRTKVAYNFQGLKLDDATKVSKLDLQKSDTPRLNPREPVAKEEDEIRKRVRVFTGVEHERGNQTIEIPETPQGKKDFKVVIGPERHVDAMVYEKAANVVLHNEVDPIIFQSGAAGKLRTGLSKAYPSINRLQDSKSRAPRRRMGSPPLFGAADASFETRDDLSDDTFVDIERAAQTWHDSEITGHNPTDPEDDGEGINGIGFKPTAAMAYERAQKRKAQMAEYKSREAREARAKRSERRRGSEVNKATKEEETARRVRFMVDQTHKSTFPA